MTRRVLRGRRRSGKRFHSIGRIPGFEDERGFLGVVREIGDLQQTAFAALMGRASSVDDGDVGSRLAERPPLHAALVHLGGRFVIRQNQQQGQLAA